MYTVRDALPGDAEKLLEIYGWYVENTAVTFEYDVPGVEEFRERISKTLEKYPYLVLEEDGRIEGFAYAGCLKARRAYDPSIEVSIYVRQEKRRRGAGKALYEALEERLRAQGVVNMYACISYAETEDEYLTNDSMRFHQHMGYRLAGKFTRCGVKFGRWYSVIWMEKIIGDREGH